jgi:dephospho-CoA kinase
MLTIGITGGIGSGKTTICKIFSQLGVPVYNSDNEAKRLYDLPEVKKELTGKFGKEIIDVDGNLDKKKFSKLIFNDEKSLKEVNALIHPMVTERFKEWKTNQTNQYILKEAAILFESGTYKDCDKIILITAPEELRIQRILQRDNISRKEIERIMSWQWSDEKKNAQSDYVIANDETQLVIPQVRDIHAKLLKLNSA